MKHMHRWILLLLVLVLMLCGCGHEGVKAPEYTVKEKDGTVWTIDPHKRTITDGEDVFKFKIKGDKEEYTIWIYYPNGETYTQDLINEEIYENLKTGNVFGRYMGSFFGFTYYYDAGPFSYPSGEELATLVYPLIREEVPPKNLLLPILLIALGCADILYPKVFWIPRYGMDFRYVELSDRTKLLQNLAGVVVIVLGIVLWIV